MTTEKLSEVLRHYYDTLTEYPGVELTDRQYAGLDAISEHAMRRHLKWMCAVCLQSLLPGGAPDDVAKANRWLGYVQGELRAMRAYSINQLRAHSRTDKPPKE